MKRNLLLLLFAMTLIVSCLASCQTQDDPSEECQHTFSEAWESNATEHWHPATCEHGEQKGDLAAHIDADEDGFCDVCEYKVNHIHTFESEWSNDETHHWKNATCTHTDVQGEKALHSDEDTNGSCDVCGTHVHSPNAAGYCKYPDCGMKVVDIDETDLEILVNAIVTQSHLINGGAVDYEFIGRSNRVESGFATHVEKTINYEFGKEGYTHTKTYTKTEGDDTFESTVEGWYHPDGPEDTFGIFTEDGGETTNLDLSDPTKLLGFYLNLSTLADGNGAEELLFNLWETTIANGVEELSIKAYPDENKVTFSYKILTVHETTIAVGDNVGNVVYNANLFIVSAEITYTDDYALTSFNVELDVYTGDAGSLVDGSANEKDIDLDYNHDTGIYSLRENALADTYKVSITQTIGERTKENPMPKNRFIPDSFDLFLDIDKNGILSNKYDNSVIKCNVRNIINLYVGNCQPEGSSVHYVADRVSFKIYRNGVEVENPEDYNNQIVGAEFTFSGQQRSFFVIPKMEGAYKLEVFFMGEKVHEVNIHAGVVDEEFIELKDNEFAVKVTEAYEWTNEVVFTAPEAGTYYFNLPEKVGFINADELDAANLTPDTSDGPAPYFDYNNAQQSDGSYRPGSFSITLEAGESIRFYVNAMSRGTYVISYFVL